MRRYLIAAIGVQAWSTCQLKLGVPFGNSQARHCCCSLILQACMGPGGSGYLGPAPPLFVRR